MVITLGSERLYSDLSRKFSSRSADPSEAVSVIRLDKSGGCVNRSEDYMKALRHAQIKEYFFGKGDETLAPSSQMADFGDLHIFRILENSQSDEGLYGGFGSGGIYEKVAPSGELVDKLLAITTAGPNDKQEVVRDASVKGYIYVAEVDEVKKKVKVLSPQPGQITGTAMVLGNWPEDVPGLVN